MELPPPYDPRAIATAACGLIDRVELTIAQAIASAHKMRERNIEHCAIPEINAFYLEWDSMVLSEETMLNVTEDSVQLKPIDEFCPFCHLEDINIEYNGIIGPLSTIIKDILENALSKAKSLDEAVLDTWFIFNAYIGRNMHGVAPSLASVNAGGRIDMPTCTIRTMIEHFTVHAINGSDVLFEYLIADADKREAIRTIQGVYNGTRRREDLDRIMRSRHARAEVSRGTALVRKKKN